jgi:hypothetical protein
MRYWYVLVTVAVVAVATDARAQQEAPVRAPVEGAHWGVQASVSPTAPVPGGSLGKIFNDQGTVDIRLNAFEIGVIHGRTAGGEVGVEIVYRKIEDGSSLSTVFPGSCTTIGSSALCFPQTGTLDRISGASLFGISVHKFAVFADVGRVQIGAVFSAGIASVIGTAEEHVYDYQFQNTGQGVVVKPTEGVTTLPLSNVLSLRSMMFIGKVEPTVAVTVAPGLKIRAGGGLNFPVYPSFTVGVSYLIGAKTH